MDLAGRSAIVTGGAGGLSAATVRHLVSLGVGTVVFDRVVRNPYLEGEHVRLDGALRFPPK